GEEVCVAHYTAPFPDVDLGLGSDFARGQLDRSRKHVRLRIRIHPGPWRLAAEMRLGEVPFSPDIEQVLDSVEVEEESVAAAAGEKCVGARLDDIRFGGEGDLGVCDDLRPYP